jgi:ribosome biogenesis protein BRX1
MYFEVKRKVRYSVWLGRYPEGPSVKVDLSNIVTVKDVRFQGNSVKGARHVLSFDGGFTGGKLGLLKELLIGIFNVPKHHPKSTGVVDSVLSFANEADTVSFRNYQVFREAVNKDKDQLDLYEIGPRFLMNVNCVLDGVMCGEVLYRAPVLKKIPKKGKMDKRKLINPTEVKPKNLFGEEEL